MGKTTRTTASRIPLLAFRLFTILLCTVLQVRSSNPKTTMGLVNTPWVIADEPGAWAVNDGALMFDAISTSLGKPNSPLKALFIGTVGPRTRRLVARSNRPRQSPQHICPGHPGRPGDVGQLADHPQGESTDGHLAGVPQAAARGTGRPHGATPG